MSRLEIKYLKENELVPYINNTRTHSREQIEKLKSSINEFGMCTPIGIHNSTIVYGHARFESLKELGYTEFPTVDLSHLSEAQMKAYIIADNRLSLDAGWDEELLKVEIEALQDMDFNIDLLGFSADELEDLDIGLEDIDLDTDKADEVPEVEENPVIKLGDLIELGHNYQHRLLCGDSTDKENIEIILKGNKAELVLTDPPYRYKKMGEGGVFDKGFKDLKDNIKDIIDFNPVEFLKSFPSSLNGNMNAYIFCNTGLVPDYLNWAVENNYNFNILTWHKKSFIPASNNHHFPDTEYLIYISKNAIFNTGLKDVVYGKYFVMDNEKSKDHPTIKPTELLENEIKISSNKNGLVFDFFGGSGSTMIACENTNRLCGMIELEEKYAQVIVQRYVDYTSNPMIKINGKECDWFKYRDGIIE